MSSSGLSPMKKKNKSPFKCLISVGGCKHLLKVTHTCCGGSSRETGPMTHCVLGPGPSMSVSTARLHLIWRVLLQGGCLCSRSGKGQEVNSRLLSAHQWCFSFLLGKCWRLTRQSPYRGCIGPCCSMIHLQPISMNWLGTGGLVTWYLLCSKAPLTLSTQDVIGDIWRT